MAKDFNEWMLQAYYDLETARVMAKAGRNFYTVFMCHLSVEKALKGLVVLKTGQTPEKTHNLIGLLSRANIRPPENISGQIIKLNEANVATRYPEELSKMIRLYDDATAKRIIADTEEVLIWIKTMQ